MSTRSLDPREGRVPLTDPKWYPTTQGLNRWINKMASRSDLAVRVLRHTSGAPARFVPTSAEIDINEGLIARIDPVTAGAPDFVVKHRAIAGACVHEAAHARFSAEINLPKIARVHGPRHAAVFAMLEEGRCETQQWPNLTGVEKLALQSMVLEIVLRDMEDDEGTVQPLDMRGVIRLMGLLAARINVGIVDITQPMGKRMHDALLDALGADFAPLYDIAVRFSEHRLGWYTRGEEPLHDLVREWMAVEDRLIPPSDEGDESGKGEGKGEGEDGGGTSPEPADDKDDESGSGEGSGEDSGEDSGEGSGEDSGDESPSKGKDNNAIGDDDEGKVGDGSKTLPPPDADGAASLGEYGSSHVDESAFADIFEAVREAAEEAEHVSGSRLREQVVSIHKATAAAHAERRRKNAEALKRWR